MKDLISATSMLFASVILVICVFQDVNFESALLRAGIGFICIYLIGFIALTLFRVTIKIENDGREDGKQHEAAVPPPENVAANA